MTLSLQNNNNNNNNGEDINNKNKKNQNNKNKGDCDDDDDEEEGENDDDDNNNNNIYLPGCQNMKVWNDIPCQSSEYRKSKWKQRNTTFKKIQEPQSSTVTTTINIGVQKWTQNTNRNNNVKKHKQKSVLLHHLIFPLLVEGLYHFILEVFTHLLNITFILLSVCNPEFYTNHWADYLKIQPHRVSHKVDGNF